MIESIFRKQNLTEGNVPKVLFSFAIPLLLSNILHQLYTIIDSIIVGQYVGKEALAAVTASYPLFYFLISLVIGIGSGISVLISHYFGGKLLSEVQRISSTYFIFLFAIGLLISWGGVWGAETIFRWIETPPDVFPEAVSYFKIYISGTVMYIVFNGFISVLRGVGDSATPLGLMVVSVVLNFILDILFVAVMGYGVQGAAIATWLSHACALILSFYYLNRHYTLLRFDRRSFCFDRTLFLEGLKLGIPAGVQQASLALGLVVLLRVVNEMGSNTLTAYGIVGRIESVISQPMLVLGSALAAMVAQNLGAGLFDRAMNAFKIAIRWTFLLCLVLCGGMILFHVPIIRLFTNESQVIEIASFYLILVFSFYILNALTCVFNGFLRGVGDTFLPMVVNIVALWVIRLPFASWGCEVWGVKGIWYAIVFSWMIALIVIIGYYYWGGWRKKQIVLRVHKLME